MHQYTDICDPSFPAQPPFLDPRHYPSQAFLSRPTKNAPASTSNHLNPPFSVICSWARKRTLIAEDHLYHQDNTESG